MEEIKKIKRHVYKNLPTYGFIGAVCLIGGSIIYFNQLWTALGENSKTQLVPQVTKNYEEFKDYTTLLLSLISAISAFLSPVLLILFYNSWKEQKNYDLNKEILLEIDSTLYSIHEELNKNSRQVTALKEIRNYKIELEKMNETKYFIHPKETNFLSSKCSLYDALNKTNIESFQYEYSLSGFRLGIILDKFFQEYYKYYKKLNIQDSKLTKNSRYIKSEIDIIQNEISKLESLFTQKYEFQKLNEDGINEIISLTYDELVNNFESSHKNFRDEIIKNIKL